MKILDSNILIYSYSEVYKYLREVMNKSGFLIVLVILLNGCHVFKRNYTFKWAVMAEPPKSLQQSANHKSTFAPSKLELKEVEKILRQTYETAYKNQFESEFPLNEFYRQYYGYWNSKNERIVFVQCYHKSWDRPGLINRSYNIIFDDGCEAVFRVQVNLGTKSFFDFNINPCA